MKTETAITVESTYDESATTTGGRATFLVPAWIRWSSFIFGFAAVAFLVQAANRLYIATQQFGNDAVVSVASIANPHRYFTLTLAAMICLTLAVLPPVLWAVTRRRDQ